MLLARLRQLALKAIRHTSKHVDLQPSDRSGGFRKFLPLPTVAQRSRIVYTLRSIMYDVSRIGRLRNQVKQFSFGCLTWLRNARLPSLGVGRSRYAPYLIRHTAKRADLIRSAPTRPHHT